jgi:uncharacterized protein YndB with AHSA1/START domain
VVVIVVVALVGALLFFAASQSDRFHIHRYILVSAPPDKIFPLVNDFHQWEKWSPWEGVEGDDLQRKYSGASAGEGAVYEWEGRKTGVGRMEIMRSQPPGELNINVDFLKPMRAQNNVEFMFEPDEGQTRVDWSMRGEHNFMGKLMAMFMNMDKMVGRDFERGLANLKALAERSK